MFCLYYEYMNAKNKTKAEVAKNVEVLFAFHLNSQWTSVWKCFIAEINIFTTWYKNSFGTTVQCKGKEYLHKYKMQFLSDLFWFIREKTIHMSRGGMDKFYWVFFILHVLLCFISFNLLIMYVFANLSRRDSTPLLIANWTLLGGHRGNKKAWQDRDKGVDAGGGQQDDTLSPLTARL